ncbi:MAG: ketoacyl-ACP synthase III [Pseudomonadota bacterium]
MKIKVSGTGRSLPAKRVTSCDLDQRLGTGDLLSATGVIARHICEAESQVDLAQAAGQAALDDAGVHASDVDLIISGASVPYQPIPATAPLIMERLGIADGTAAAFDVNATCLGFITGLETAARMIIGGAARCALVVSSEVASRALPWDTEPEVAALFGDGAAAAVLRPGGDRASGRIKAVYMRSFPSAYDACGIGAGGTRFHFGSQRDDFLAHATFAMNGRDLFRITALHFNGFLDNLLERAGWTKDDVDWVVPHQASPGALDHLVRQTGFETHRVVRIVRDYGNQIAASIPFAFDIARRDGRIREGQNILLLGTSAGVSFGGVALVA